MKAPTASLATVRLPPINTLTSPSPLSHHPTSQYFATPAEKNTQNTDAVRNGQRDDNDLLLFGVVAHININRDLSERYCSCPGQIGFLFVSDRCKIREMTAAPGRPIPSAVSAIAWNISTMYQGTKLLQYIRIILFGNMLSITEHGHIAFESTPPLINCGRYPVRRVTRLSADARILNAITPRRSTAIVPRILNIIATSKQDAFA